MKPPHIALLVIGAALAGGLAMKMTQPPVIATSVAPPVVTVRVASTKPSPIKTAPAPEAAPAPVYGEAPKRGLVKQAIRKTKPISIARLETTGPSAPPVQWAPVPYVAQQQKAEAPVETPKPEPVREPEPLPKQQMEPRRVTLQTGMTVAVRITEALASDHAAPGDRFQATLAEPLVVDGLVIAERGARAGGRIVDAQRGVVELALTDVTMSDGQRVALLTDPWTKQTEPTFFRSTARVSTDTVIHFRLSNRVTVTEQIAAR